MPAKRRRTTDSNHTGTSTHSKGTKGKGKQVSIAGGGAASFSFSEAGNALALQLIQAALDDDLAAVAELVQQGTEAWVQDDQGWSSLHAAASVGNVQMIEFLLRKGNAVWNLVDNLGYTAGDIAYSLNQAEAYEALLEEGVRAEMIKAVLEASGGAGADGGGDDDHDEDLDSEMPDSDKQLLSTASDNKTFLHSKLRFITDETGQEVCVDKEGNGVMMGWESGIMRETVDEMLRPFAGRRKLTREEVTKPSIGEDGEEEDAEELSVLNVGFGLGIIDSFLQEYHPTNHLIIEPHPDVLAHARSRGWFEKPGVRFYEGTWQQYVQDLEDEKESYESFDAVYFDTYSEHYKDLHAFFDLLPNMLRSSLSLFSFFHGLGATSRSFYDIYTSVSELHLREIGLETVWKDVVINEATATGTWDGVERKYWGDVGPYRLPVCHLEF
ncbi:hypothetical protein T439DRAFT_313704 [Meredithblackwellia eburnea MCA 4105]